jgi:hypothetical protein
MIPQWAEAFETSEAAVIRQLAWAHGWIDCNPKKAPKKDVMRFLWNWMRTAKKMGNLVESQLNLRERSALEHNEANYDMTYEEMVAIRKQNMSRTA